MLRRYILIAGALSVGFAYLNGAVSDDHIKRSTMQTLSESPIPIVVLPEQQAALSSGIKGYITQVYFKEGEQFAPGDPIVSFDCKTYQAALEQAQANLNTASFLYNSRLALDKLQASSKADVIKAKSELDHATAEVAMNQSYVENCTIAAPFHGVVTNLHIHPFETITEGQSVVDIVSVGAPKLEMLVPSEYITTVREGYPFLVAIDETRQTYNAHITKVIPNINPINQMFKVSAAFDKAEPSILPGMTGQAYFSAEAKDERKRQN